MHLTMYIYIYIYMCPDVPKFYELCIHNNRAKVKQVGDRNGATDENRANRGASGQFGVPSTPFMTAQTPLHAPPTPYGMCY
jgi:hypothetical protein